MRLPMSDAPTLYPFYEHHVGSQSGAILSFRIAGGIPLLRMFILRNLTLSRPHSGP